MEIPNIEELRSREITLFQSIQTNEYWINVKNKLSKSTHHINFQIFSFYIRYLCEINFINVLQSDSKYGK